MLLVNITIFTLIHIWGINRLWFVCSLESTDAGWKFRNTKSKIVLRNVDLFWFSSSSTLLCCKARFSYLILDGLRWPHVVNLGNYFPNQMYPRGISGDGVVQRWPLLHQVVWVKEELVGKESVAFLVQGILYLSWN